jgi:tetratricopeptide (TPR) repeat protein
MTPMDDGLAVSMLELAERTGPKLTGPEARAAQADLEARSDDLQSALAWFVDRGRADEALRLVNALYRFWIVRQAFDEGARWFARVLASPGGDERRRGQADLHAGFMPFWMGDDIAASEHFRRALATGRRLGDAPLTSQALGGLARVALRTDVAEGRRLAHEALAVSVAADDEAGRSNALHLLGVGAQIAGDLLEARDWMVQRLALVRSTRNEFLIGSEAANLSMVERQLGNLEAAEALDREALEIDRRTGDRFVTPFALSGLASIAVERAAFERAAVFIGAAEAIMEAKRMAWPPDERPHYERLLADLRAAMGEATSERLRRRGREMVLDEVIDLALTPTTS